LLIQAAVLVQTVLPVTVNHAAIVQQVTAQRVIVSLVLRLLVTSHLLTANHVQTNLPVSVNHVNHVKTNLA
jgi:hypothetical protein